MNLFIWLGIAFCVSQSAMFSGLNLAFFSVTRLRLEIEAETNPVAKKVHEMRRDVNSLLTTILWSDDASPLDFTHRPIIVTADETPLGNVIQKLEFEQEHLEDDVIDNDIILLWGRSKRIITGADILGRLLRGISQIRRAKHEQKHICQQSLD